MGAGFEPAGDFLDLHGLATRCFGPDSANPPNKTEFLKLTNFINLNLAYFKNPINVGTNYTMV